MTLSPFPAQRTDSDHRWMLWVDGCGGFLLVMKSMVRVGRQSPGGQMDVGLIADVPQSAGRIIRDQADYYWHAKGANQSTSTDQSPSQDSVGRKWIEPGSEIGGLGSAKLRLRKPSALCSSAVLTLDPPHRFGGHIDAVLLVNQTWLIGPSDDCHIRCRSLSSPLVVSRSTGKKTEKKPGRNTERWWIKQGFGGAPKELPVGRQFTMGEAASAEVTMLLEPFGSSAIH